MTLNQSEILTLEITIFILWLKNYDEKWLRKFRFAANYLAKPASLADFLALGSSNFEGAKVGFTQCYTKTYIQLQNGITESVKSYNLHQKAEFSDFRA